MPLLDALATVPDPRRSQGRRHPLAPILVAVVMAMLAGHHGYRSIARFIRANDGDLRRRLPFGRHILPSHVTVRAILQAVDPRALADAFRAWAAEQLPPGTDLARDAEATRSTVADADSALLDLAALVSAYASRSGLAAAEPHASGDESDAAQGHVDRLAGALGLTDTPA